MPGAGTDKTKRWVETPGPVVILVEPQLGENIGAAARAMANFGLSRMRLVRPRQGWPNDRAHMMAAGADRVLDGAVLYDDLPSAIADCTFVLATTARAHDQAKPVIGAADAAAELAPRVAAGETTAIVFGRERNGLENDEVALADRIVTLPVNPAFASLNLAQAVAIMSYEWFKLQSDAGLPFTMPRKSAAAPKEQLLAFFAALERELEKVEFFRPPDKRETMQINLRNIFTRMAPTQQDIQTLHGVLMSIAEGRKGPARGGVLDGEQAELLRVLLAEHGPGRVPKERGPVRGLAQLLRRNPTEAERALWDALVNDRRFAGRGFKRQTPVGQHICDFVSFPLRLVIDLVPPDESVAAAKARGEKRGWLEAHNYTVLGISAGDIESDMAAALDESIGQSGKDSSAGITGIATMHWKNSNSRYGVVPQAVHWLTFLCVTAGWLLGWFLDDIPKGSARSFGLLAHMTLGQLVFALVIVRLLWRFTNPPPRPERTRYGRMLEYVATLSHYALYALLLAVPFLGVIVQLKRGNALPIFGVWEFASPWPVDRNLARTILRVHEYLANTLLIIAGAHACAALVHHYVFRDRTLVRMLPGAV